MHHKVLFTSDIHGNEVQYRKLADYAIDISADSVIIGGDIAPKKFRDDSSVVGQRVFLEERLPELLRPLKEKGQSTVLLIMGNDDCAANLDALEEKDSSLFKLIHGKRIELTREIDVVGYSYVPITPFGIKAWEKYDLSEVPENLFEDYRLRKIFNTQAFWVQDGED
ncbi:metallophosphoesterase [Candidatus Bathyarchaeota archaeon]|nr:metallophosphoesterase [Candidatus Bathyarchaeota archaeon]